MRANRFFFHNTLQLFIIIVYKQVDLGRATQHTVYEGESVGQLLGLRLLYDSGINLNRREISLGVDSQAVIKGHNNRIRSSASYITEEIYRLVNTLTSTYPRANFTVRWTPGHVG